MLLQGISLFNADLREVMEMLYQFEEPFVVDSSVARDRVWDAGDAVDGGDIFSAGEWRKWRRYYEQENGLH